MSHSLLTIIIFLEIFHHLIYFSLSIFYKLALIFKTRSVIATFFVVKIGRNKLFLVTDSWAHCLEPLISNFIPFLGILLDVGWNYENRVHLHLRTFKFHLHGVLVL